MITDSRWSAVPIEAANLNSTISLVVEDDAPGYTDLLEERQNLLKRIEWLERAIAEANQRADDMWGCVEDVAIGAKIECPTCLQFKPCMCDKGPL